MVSNPDLFAGRKEQIDRVFGAVFSPGQHAAIYGERGVGKSSLATIIYDVVILSGQHTFIPAKILNLLAKCIGQASFAGIFR
jgi:ABC-type transport system involved in cytochrome bd biosynthesis fused ATPase/permease subunit